MMENQIAARLCCILIGYLFGCILTAEIVAKVKTGKSTSEIGSGNPGMANLMTNVGFSAGALTLAGDILKVILAVTLCYFLFPSLSLARLNIYYAGIGTCLGHNFPFYRRFQGGKGVTTTCSSIVFYQPIPGLISCIVGMLVVFKTGLLPVGAVLIPLVFTPYVFWQYGLEPGFLTLLLTIMMFARHWHGLERVREGKEESHAKLFK